ncbi:MAG: DUF1992 domain-containing protein [Geodermatophilales bacterium]|nr:DUF1992 domain-containing protein [Geodermatophilales bacterium]
MTERKPPGTSWESWVDAQIARGLARGDFDDLPGAGKPLPQPDREQTSYDWALAWARRENADVLGMLPPGLALRKEREDLPRRAEAMPSEVVPASDGRAGGDPRATDVAGPVAVAASGMTAPCRARGLTLRRKAVTR